MTAPAEEHPIPSELGEFSVEGRLGEGGGGIVYAATWHGEPVALKVLRPLAEVSEKARARFVEEASTIRKVEHPALVRLLGAGTLPDGRPYLAMPRLEGETLHQRAARGPIPATEAAALFAALASGVAALHDAGMVHRDIKPENVFLERTAAGAVRPVLLDFGIAREVGRADSTTTDAGIVRGTPAYMAPERVFGSAANVRTDVYELAVTFYVMLTGTLPWDGAAEDASGRLDPRPPSAQGAAVPPKVETALLRALSTRPESRPASARAFADAIDAAFASPAAESPRRTVGIAVTPPTPAPAPPPASTTGAAFVATEERPVSRMRLAALGVAAVAAALAIGFLRRPSEPSVVIVPPETRATAEAPPEALVAAKASLTTSAAPAPPASYVVPPRYQPRPRAVAIADAGSAASDPSRFYQDRK